MEKHRRNPYKKLFTSDDIKTTCFAPQTQPTTTPKLKAVSRDPRKILHRRYEHSIENKVLPNPFSLPNRLRSFSKQVEKKKDVILPKITSDIKTVVDIDKAFFTKVEGRPIRPNNDIKLYMRNVRDIAMCKAKAGFNYDQIMQIDWVLSGEEMMQYKKSEELYNSTRDNFVHYLHYNFNIVQAIQSKADTQAQALEEISVEMETISHSYNKLRNELIVLGGKIDLLTSFRRFIFRISPVWWRAQHDENFTDRSEKFTLLSKLFTRKLSHEQIIEKSKATLGQGHLELYFKSPDEVEEMFEYLRKMCLNYILKYEMFSEHLLRPVQKYRDLLKRELGVQVDELEFLIDTYDQQIGWMEKREGEYLTKFYLMLRGTFKDLYASSSTVKLCTCVQYVNTKLFGNPEDPNDSVTLLMKEIELDYEYQLLLLDKLDQNVVKEAVNTATKKDKEMMKKAYTAQRTLTLFEQLKKNLYASFAPPFKPLRRGT